MRWFFVIFSLIPCLAFGQTYQVGDNLNVNARSGLNVRNVPGVQGSQIGFLEYGQKVKVISKEFINQRDTFDNLDGGWIEIEMGEVKGYVFDGYLTKLPILDFQLKNDNEDRGICLFQSMDKYVESNFEINDTTNYYNGSDGEGDHGMNIMELNNFGQFIKHTYWESFESELQLEKVSEGEALNLVKSIFESCDLLTKKIEQDLKSSSYLRLFKGEFEVGLKMKWTERRFYFSISGGP